MPQIDREQVEQAVLDQAHGPCADLRARANDRWNEELEALAQECASLRLGGGRGITDLVSEGRWMLVRRSSVIPLLRLYRLEGCRYPETVALDLMKGEKLDGRVESAAFNVRLSEHRARVTNGESAADLARFFVALAAQPYLPVDTRAEAVAAGTGWDVTVHHSMTVPWSPPKAGIIAGERTMERATVIHVDSSADGYAQVAATGSRLKSEKTWP